MYRACDQVLSLVATHATGIAIPTTEARRRASTGTIGNKPSKDYCCRASIALGLFCYSTLSI